MTDKVIVTNMSALKSKYKPAGMKAIDTAIKKLIAADKKRDLKTIVIALDDAKAMKELGAKPVADASSFKENKTAIDGVYAALAPDYLMILGAIDVVPHQDLKNSVFSTKPDGDAEKFAFGDLPYACDAPYSRNIKDFTGPTRVVGRLPDLTGQDKPDYLVGLLETAATWKSFKKSDYQPYLGISAEVWQESTALSLANIFNSSDDLQTSPTQGFKWKAKLINRRTHFINCHGDDTFPDFLGQSSTDEDDMPTSHQAAFIAKTGKIVEGTIAAAECCFGGQLYDPSGADGQMGMCNTYLDKKAYGFFGSTTTAYGPETGNDQADLICQYFIQRVLAGASLGRAALEARQRFVEKSLPLSPTNRKTLAQFNLYGDPSIVPVASSTANNVIAAVKATSKSAVASNAVEAAGAVERSERRRTLRAKGALLSELQPHMTRSKQAAPPRIRTSLEKIMDQLNFRPVDCISYKVQAAPKIPLISKSAAKSPAVKKPSTTAFHVMFGRRRDAETPAAVAATTDGADNKKRPIRKLVVLEAKEVDGKIVSVKEAHSK